MSKEIQQIDAEIHNIHDQCYQANCTKCISSCTLSKEIDILKKQRVNAEVAMQCDDQGVEEY